jgi:hypothetical protein
LSVESISDDVLETRLGDEVLVPARVTRNSQSLDGLAYPAFTRSVCAHHGLNNSPVKSRPRDEMDAARLSKSDPVVQPSTRSGLHSCTSRSMAHHTDSRGPLLLSRTKPLRAALPVAELQAR